MSNWALIIYCGLITYLTRFSMIALIKKEMFNDRIREVLSYVPSAIFPAIIFPAIFLDNSGSILIEDNPKIMAALIATLIGIVSSSNGFSKETTFKKELFDKAQAEGKVVIVSSWIKYCSSCASQMKVLDKAKNDFDNIEYFAFDVTNKEIAELFDVQYQTTLLIFKNRKLVYRSIGETSKDLIYKAIKSSI